MSDNKKKEAVTVPEPPKEVVELWGTGQTKVVTPEGFFKHYNIPKEKQFSFRISEMNHIDYQRHKFAADDMSAAIQTARAELGFSAEDIQEQRLTDAEYEKLNASMVGALPHRDRMRIAEMKEELTVKYCTALIAGGEESDYTADVHSQLKSPTIKNWLYNQIVGYSSFESTGVDITAFL